MPAAARSSQRARTPAPPYSSPDESVCVTSHIPSRGTNEAGDLRRGDARKSSRATTARLTTASSTSPPSRPSIRRASTAESTDEGGGGGEMAPTNRISVGRLMRRYVSIGEVGEADEVSPARREPDSPARSPRPWRPEIPQRRHGVADSSRSSSDARASGEARQRVCLERRRSSAQRQSSHVTPVTAVAVEVSPSRESARAEPVIR